jgi:hypothetical protein
MPPPYGFDSTASKPPERDLRTHSFARRCHSSGVVARGVREVLGGADSPGVTMSERAKQKLGELGHRHCSADWVIATWLLGSPMRRSRA